MLGTTLALMAASPGGLAAQDRTLEAGASVGRMAFDRRSALGDAPVVAVAASATWPVRVGGYAIDGVSIGVGLAGGAAQPITRGTQFPLVTVDAGDTTSLYAVSQRIHLVQAQLRGLITYSAGPIRMEGFVGGGAYRMTLGADASGPRGISAKPLLTWGGAVSYAMTARTRWRVELGADRFFAFDRSRLDATASYPRDRLVSDILPAPDSPTRTPTNAHLAIGAQFALGGK